MQVDNFGSTRNCIKPAQGDKYYSAVLQKTESVWEYFLCFIYKLPVEYHI